MSRLTDRNQAPRRQAPRSLWLPALATPSGALGECLRRDEATAGTRAANANRTRAGLVETVVRALKRRQTAKLLRRLDARQLNDIGITRGQIDEIAAAAAAEAVARKGSYAMPRFAPLATLRRAWRRQAAIAALHRLSDHTLADIGIERLRIAESVDAMMAMGADRPAPARAAVTAKLAEAAAPTPVAVAAPSHKAAA